MSTALDRRQFMGAAALLGGGLVIGVSLTGCGSKPRLAATPSVPVDLNVWLQVGTDGVVRFYCDRSEMGQGVYTALPMLIAEELGVALESVKVEFAPAGEAFTNNLLGTQITGGSTSVRDAWVKLRTAGAQAREMLVAAACAEWDIGREGCKTENGEVVSPKGDRLSFGALATAAGKLPVPKDVKLKDAQAFTLVGKPQKRLDTPSKVDGSAIYGIDVRLDGMLYGALAQPPVLGGKLRDFDAAAAKAMPGVVDVVRTDSGVVVVADNWWRARKARDALRINWDAGSNAGLDTADIMRGLKAASSKAGVEARNDGDAVGTLRAAQKGGRVVTAGYELPLLAHATLEPQNCTAHVTADGCDIYVPTQIQIVAQGTAAAAAGLKPEQVRVHTTFLGGGFGRRLEVDFIPAAVQASKAVGKPVKVLWTREDDTTHDAYRPPAFDVASAALGEDGKPTAWHLHLTGPSITARMFPAVVEKAIDPFVIEAATNYPYDVPNVRVTYNRHEIGINVGYWRSVSHALNCFVAESFMDELAAAAGKDPLEFRLSLLGKQPRYAAVLKRVADEAGYGKPAAGHSLGVALMEGYGTYLAMIADVTVEGGKLKVHDLHCAVDCGQTVNPDTVEAQVQSAALFGLTAALWGQIDLAGGRVQQTNFDRYRLLRMPEAPRIHTYLVESTADPGGIGEPATALVAPAVANALFRATRKRVRSLPLARHGLA
ncbi:MAG TPA: molybdopterin cofactor-binding domain-containing protein [Steroidobacteraceae bacterium]|nr:molybdopterin cofactor-binding domain-containing protein [Steroidobacteraceae bacterium]